MGDIFWRVGCLLPPEIAHKAFLLYLRYAGAITNWWQSIGYCILDWAEREIERRENSDAP